MEEKEKEIIIDEEGNVVEEKKESEKKSEEKKPNVKNDDVAKKLIFCLNYVWGILFFLPLILWPNDEEAKRHANQGLVLLIFSVAGSFLFGILTLFGGVFGVVFSILSTIYVIMLLLLGLVGIIYVLTDKKEPLPIIGNIKIIK